MLQEASGACRISITDCDGNWHRFFLSLLWKNTSVKTKVKHETMPNRIQVFIHRFSDKGRTIEIEKRGETTRYINEIKKKLSFRIFDVAFNYTIIFISFLSLPKCFSIKI